MDGIILVNKESGMTSRDVVNKISHIFNTKKVGHTGTLDPMATGVLAVGIGKALKVLERYELKDILFDVKIDEEEKNLLKKSIKEEKKSIKNVTKGAEAMSTFAITTLCTITGIALTALFSFLAYQRAQKKEHKDEGENKGVMMSDIGYIKAGVDDLKREQRETAASVGRLSERITRVEESTKQAHKRIDELKGE